MQTTSMRTEQQADAADEIQRTFDMDALTEFLQDPIGYGEFDSDDPITLGDYDTSRHFRGCYAAPLAF